EAVRAEAKVAHDMLGISRTHWLEQPAAQLAETPHAALNAAIHRIVKELQPKTLLVPFVGDIHLDHQLIFLSSLVAARPHQAEYPPTILAYETLSETNWNAPYLTPNFVPHVFIDITETIEKKIEAIKMFGSQVRDAPHERSVSALRALATLRGATVHRAAAEAFVMVRHVL
ncbi:MAG: PIG-L family deacetylase, partial [Alphaproteobacteria bacterium]|nr:PIG-L family deacetylase [Alphaproteobacteria bacterium]